MQYRQRKLKWPLLGSLAIGLAFPLLCGAQTASACGNLANAFGPFDYRTERGINLRVVENNHFATTVEQLIKGQTGELGGDLDYTLRAFPNHHRALLAMMRYGKKLKTTTVPGVTLSVECYFERAIRFRNDDTTARMLYATFLHDNARDKEAIAQLDITFGLAGDNGFTHYNIGMVAADMGMFDRALSQAHLAMKLGFTRTELKQRLVSAGKWLEPSAEPAPLPAETASAPQ